MQYTTLCKAVTSRLRPRSLSNPVLLQMHLVSQGMRVKSCVPDPLTVFRFANSDLTISKLFQGCFTWCWPGAAQWQNSILFGHAWWDTIESKNVIAETFQCLEVRLLTPCNQTLLIAEDPAISTLGNFPRTICHPWPWCNELPPRSD